MPLGDFRQSQLGAGGYTIQVESRSEGLRSTMTLRTDGAGYVVHGSCAAY